MSMNKANIHQRTEAARAAIAAAYGSEADEFGTTRFISHHLEEIEPTYWKGKFNTATPEPISILEALVLRSESNNDDEIDILDFTLPGNVTNYVLCVTFNDEGEVVDISMES